MAKLLPALGGSFLQAPSEVAAVNMMYGAGGAGAAHDDVHVVARLQPDARGRLVHDRRRGPRRVRERDARRARPREHRAGAGGPEARLPRARPRQHPRDRARAGDAAGDARLHDARLRPRVPLPEPGRDLRRRAPRPDDRQGGAAARARPAGPARLGGLRRRRRTGEPRSLDPPSRERPGGAEPPPLREVRAHGRGGAARGALPLRGRRDARGRVRHARAAWRRAR